MLSTYPSGVPNTCISAITAELHLFESLAVLICKSTEGSEAAIATFTTGFANHFLGLRGWRIPPDSFHRSARGANAQYHEASFFVGSRPVILVCNDFRITTIRTINLEPQKTRFWGGCFDPISHLIFLTLLLRVIAYKCCDISHPT